jgi:hypothetical protein
MSDSAIDWKSLGDYAIALGAILGYVALALEIFLHYTDLKRILMRPNFQLAMRPQGDFYAAIAVTNAKTSWRVCDATDCEGKLAIKKHETTDDEHFDVKGTTPLMWEGEEEVLRRLPAGALPEYLQAFVYRFVDDELYVRVRGGRESYIPPSLRLDILVEIRSNERTVSSWLRDVDIVQCIRNGKFPEFTDDC